MVKKLIILSGSLIILTLLAISISYIPNNLDIGVKNIILDDKNLIFSGPIRPETNLEHFKKTGDSINN